MTNTENLKGSKTEKKMPICEITERNEKSLNQGSANKSKDMSTLQQRRQSPTTLTWHASKYKVLRQRYILNKQTKESNKLFNEKILRALFFQTPCLL